MTGALAVQNLTVTAQGRTLVDGVTLSASGLTGLIGPNGAGKSTLLKAIAGLVPTTAGIVMFEGENLLDMPRRQRAQRVAFVEQNATTEERLTVRDVVALGRVPFQSIWQAGPDTGDRAIVEQHLGEVGLGHLGQRQFNTLSGGEQQRVLLARALAQQPRLLILDEPTSHLDISAQLTVLELLRRKAGQGLTVLLALHDLNLAASYCDSVAVLHDARLRLQGPPEAVLTPALIESVYGVRALALPHPATGRPVIVYEPRESN